jgi:hypothetical protein
MATMDFGTLLIYTCSNNCMPVEEKSPNTSTPPFWLFEEYVVIQGDPTEHFANHIKKVKEGKQVPPIGQK